MSGGSVCIGNLAEMLERTSNKISYYNGQKYNSLSYIRETRKMHGVKRVMIFCLMTAVLPTILIITPLYLRHIVFADIVYPVAESDILAIQEGVSSIFCDSLQLRMNSSFNAFQLMGTPKISSKRRHIRLKKSMTLPDDTLEYWGFYLLKGSLVRLKVCSRYDGSRILVVRGGKDLNTCQLMEHNYQKFGAKMDEEHSRVKVTFETPAEVIGLIDVDNYHDENMAKEDNKDYTFARNNNDVQEDNSFNNGSAVYNAETVNKTNSSRIRHRKRHVNKFRRKIDKLRRTLDDEEKPFHDRTKRSISPLDQHIAHGGNANSTDLNLESKSVSSFETDLLTCYDGKILLTRSFLPSRHCNSVQYLDQSNHMVTEHLVNTDGYYYYIFYSDNDFIKNDIHAVFDIYKPTYRFANSSSGMECINKTECEFPIGLLSDQTVIVEVPTRDGIEHEVDDITLLTSTCKPRMGIYVIFPVMVLVCILVCAFL